MTWRRSMVAAMTEGRTSHRTMAVTTVKYFYSANFKMIQRLKLCSDHYYLCHKYMLNTNLYNDIKSVFINLSKYYLPLTTLSAELLFTRQAHKNL